VLQDSKMNFQVARGSRLIALSTGRDSMAMRTVAILTMFFLPGSFIAVSPPPEVRLYYLRAIDDMKDAVCLADL